MRDTITTSDSDRSDLDRRGSSTRGAPHEDTTTEDETEYDDQTDTDTAAPTVSEMPTSRGCSGCPGGRGTMTNPDGIILYSLTYQKSHVKILNRQNGRL